MSRRANISPLQRVQRLGHVGNSSYYSDACSCGTEDFADTSSSGLHACLAQKTILTRAFRTEKIKSDKQADTTIHTIAIIVPRDAKAVSLHLGDASIGLSPGQMLTVTSLSQNGRTRIAASPRDLFVGDVLSLADLATLQFLPSGDLSDTLSVLELRSMGKSDDVTVVRVTIATEAHTGRNAIRVGPKNVATVDMDPLAIGLIAALTTALAAAPAAAIPSHAPDAGAPIDRPDGQVRADLAPKSDDPAQLPLNDEPSVTGNVPRGQGQGQRASDAPRRLTGSSTPPDIWHGGEAPLDNWASPRLEQVMTIPRTGRGFGSDRLGDDRGTGLDYSGSPGVPFLAGSPSRSGGGSTATLPADSAAGAPTSSDGPPSAVPLIAGPVAANDGSYVVVSGKLTIQATTLLANDRASPGLTLSISGVFDAQHGTVTYDTASNAITFVSAAGYRGNASFSYTVKDDQGRSAEASVSLFVVPDETLFSAFAQPNVDRVNDVDPVELGVRFVSTSDGVITGLRFYKGVDNVGPHTANLWDPAGNLLATATFDAETGSGWQQVSFSSPVMIRAGICYVASYHTSGLYSADAGYFATPVTNGELTAIGSVYAYGAGSAFPTNTYNAHNYWVDVVFNRPPVAPDPQDDIVGAIRSGQATSFASSRLLANDYNPDGVPLMVTGAGNALHGTVSYDQLTQSVTFTPSQGYSGTAGFSYTVADNFGGSATADVRLWVDGAQPASFYSASAVPSLVTAHDNQSVELGFKFESTMDGQVLGLRFYKGIDNTGTHVGNLWSATGDLLASATFTNETASGWQEVLFLAPVSLSAGTTYVASYHSDGNYAADPNYFANTQTNGVLIAPASTAGSANGLYAYGSSSLFPTNSFNATSYGVDVLFKANLTG
ncbi:MAG: DUF4082 domain-containing protein [Alcaligenaceae bacterium]|nr:MAG: DUF4082 domain-containing protein [Alcaligenaceae bacterium]